MDITVKSTCDVSPRLTEEARARMTHATRFYDRLSSVEVVLREESPRRSGQTAVVEVTAHAKGVQVRAEGTASEHRDALEAAASRFERRLLRMKDRRLDGRRRGTRPVPGDGDGRLGLLLDATRDAPKPPEEAEEPGPRIVRTKRFPLQHMTAEEAAVRLELLGHDFFLYVDAADGACSVAYRRRDGDVGVIAAATGDEADGPDGPGAASR